MEYIHRKIEKVIQETLARKKSLLLLGARQTGKTTLLQHIQHDLSISFIRPDVRLRYEKNPEILIHEVEALAPEKQQPKKNLLVMLDEVQKIPQILDVVQDLIDRNVAQFILTGSSARKLRRGSHTNLLPGRIVALRLDPLLMEEYQKASLEELLIFGSLPGVLSVKNSQDKERDLQSYVTTYLEEEVRAEAIVRNLGSFAKFLEFAASESGRIVNFSKLSQEIGVALTTIQSYYQILEDCLIGEKVEPLTQSTVRKRLTKAPKFIFFDLGVRRLAAREGQQLPKDSMGFLFEQFVGLELIRISRQQSPEASVHFWRDPNGPEVDWVINAGKNLIPIEVKWTDVPTETDVRHLKLFLREYPKAQKGFLICRVPRKMKMGDQITILPWRDLGHVFTNESKK